MASKLIEPARLDLRAPGWSGDLPRQGGELRTVQFQSLPPVSELERIGAFIERHPHVAIRAYGGYDGSISDRVALAPIAAARGHEEVRGGGRETTGRVLVA